MPPDPMDVMDRRERDYNDARPTPQPDENVSPRTIEGWHDCPPGHCWPPSPVPPRGDDVTFSVMPIGTGVQTRQHLEALVRAVGYMQDETGIKHDILDHTAAEVRDFLARLAHPDSDGEDR